MSRTPGRIASGWTLLELIVAMGVALLILSVGAALFQFPHLLLVRQSGMTADGRTADRRLRDDLSGAVHETLPTSISLRLNSPLPTPPTMALLEFVVAQPSPASSPPGEFTLVEIRHRIAADEGSPHRMLWFRQSKPLGHDEWGEEIQMEAHEGRLEFEVWTGTTWTNRWPLSPTQPLPAALRFSRGKDGEGQSLVIPLPAAFTAGRERASPTSRSTSDRAGRRNAPRRTD